MPLSLKKKFFPLIFLDRKLYSMMKEKLVWGNIDEKKSSNRSALFIFLVFSYRFATFYMGKCCCARCRDIRADPRKWICGFQKFSSFDCFLLSFCPTGRSGAGTSIIKLFFVSFSDTPLVQEQIIPHKMAATTHTNVIFLINYQIKNTTNISRVKIQILNNINTYSSYQLICFYQ